MLRPTLPSRMLGFCALFVALLSSPSLAMVSTFTGGDPGEGLDLQGRFIYAVNTRGPGGFKVGDAFFTSDQNLSNVQVDAGFTGYSQNAGSEILNWSTPNFGASTNDNNLEVVMQSIRHGAPGGQHQVNLANLVVGREYKLQLLFTEACCNRAMDVSVNGTLVADNFNIPTTIGGINAAPTNGAVVTHSFVAASSTANILLNGPGATGVGIDTNPILNGFTLEDTSGFNLLPFNIALNKPVTATSTFSGTFAANRAVDGVIGDAQGNQWLAANGVTNASLTIDLQGTFDINSFDLLNTGNAGFLDRATGTFSIDVAGPDNVFRTVVSPRSLQFFTSGFQTELVNERLVSFVRFNMLSIVDPDNGGPFPLAGGGLNEIRVNGTFSIPEPASAVLGLMGMLGLAARRRRIA